MPDQFIGTTNRNQRNGPSMAFDGVSAVATAERPYEALDLVTMALPPCARDWSLTSRLWIHS